MNMKLFKCELSIDTESFALYEGSLSMISFESITSVRTPLTAG